MFSTLCLGGDVGEYIGGDSLALTTAILLRVLQGEKRILAVVLVSLRVVPVGLHIVETNAVDVGDGFDIADSDLVGCDAYIWSVFGV